MSLMKTTKEIAVTDIANTGHMGTIYGVKDDAAFGVFSTVGGGVVVASLFGFICDPSNPELLVSIYGAFMAVSAPLGYFVGKRLSIKKSIKEIVGGGENYKILYKETKPARTPSSSTPVKVIPLQVEGSAGKFHLIVEGKRITVRENLSDDILWDRALETVTEQYEISEERTTSKGALA